MEGIEGLRRDLLYAQRGAGAPGPRLSAHLAGTEDDVHEAQRLRYQVFAEERAAELPNKALRVDRDRYDAHCQHIVARDRCSGEIVGTYRLLDHDGALRAGGFYAESEFDLGRIRHLGPSTVEVGRACVKPAYRNGATISILWGALLRHILRHGYRLVIGCASVGTTDGDDVAASICRRLLARHLAPEEWRVFPRQAFGLEGWADVPDAPIPGLIRAYLRLGALVCGDPAWDPDFKTADLLMILPIASANTRYVERILRAA